MLTLGNFSTGRTKILTNIDYPPSAEGFTFLGLVRLSDFHRKPLLITVDVSLENLLSHHKPLETYNAKLSNCDCYKDTECVKHLTILDYLRKDIGGTLLGL